MSGRPDDEEEELRLATLQNARAIFQARKRAEEELVRTKEELWKQSEWLRVTMASIGDAVVTTDNEGRVLSLNTVAESLTGWTEQDALGRPLAEVFRIVNEESREPVENPAERVLREGRIVGLANHTVLIARDGTETPIDDSAAPIRDAEGRIHGVVLIFRSIAERKQAEQALEQSERELSDFFENASVGLHWVGPDGTILRVNRAELGLLGYSREEYLGHNIAEFHVDQGAIADILRRLTAGEILRDYEARMRCKDGSVRHVLIDSSVLWQDGQFVHTRCFTRDITDRRRMEETQARLAAIVESSDDAIISKTLESRILTWNAAAERLFGYTAEEAIGQSILMLIPPDRQHEENLIIERLSRGEKIEHYETVRITKQGRFIDVSLTISPLRDSAGRVVGASKIARDITERKQAESALRESEQRFRLMATTAPSIIWTAAPDGTITFANERWFEYCGLTSEENRRGWPGLVLHPEDRERCIAAWTAALREGTPYEIEVRNRRHDGVYRWFVTRAVPLRDASGQIVQWFGTTTDIDERKQAEQTSRFLADASSALAELTDYESTLQKVAALAVPQFADWCAVDMQEANGSVRRLAVAHVDPAKVQLAHELDRKYLSRAEEPSGVRRVIATGKPEWAASIPDQMLVDLTQGEEHLRIIRALGFRSYVSVPLRSRTQVLGALTFVTAESGRVYDERDLRAAQDLAHRAVIAIENARLLATLKETDQRKDEFLAMLAHELRNPLAPIRNAVQIFRAKGVAGPEQQWATELIDRQVHQMTRLVDDLLDVSRITRGKIELRKHVVDLSTIVNSAVEASRPLIEKWGHQLTVAIPPEPIQLEADPERLSQVLSNLLNNAAKYTEIRGSIELGAEQQGEQVLIRVKDNGIGIQADMLRRIFEMFTQVDRSLERAEGGLGIGLTLVQRLVEMHGGTVEARSEGVGKGSEFLVHLPVVTKDRLEGGRRGTEQRDPAAPLRRILVVDDNRDAADSLAMLLRMLGNEVHTAHDGLEAVGAAAAFQPEVVLLDIGLPKLSGFDAARQIRQQQGGASMLLVALTGWGQEEDRRRSQEAGFDHHMTKPVDFGALQTLLADTRGTASGGNKAH